jgi:hypothetical protein
MLKWSLAACCVALLVAPFDASPQTPDKPAAKQPTTMTRIGCVSEAPINSRVYTFSDVESGGTFRLSGKSVRKYVGQRVEIVGGPRGKGLSVRGGLWPSPNVAAQSGAIDPAQAAIASQPGGGSIGIGGPDLPEFHVVRVRGVEGACQ